MTTLIALLLIFIALVLLFALPWVGIPALMVVLFISMLVVAWKIIKAIAAPVPNGAWGGTTAEERDTPPWAREPKLADTMQPAAPHQEAPSHRPSEGHDNADDLDYVSPSLRDAGGSVPKPKDDY